MYFDNGLSQEFPKCSGSAEASGEHTRPRVSVFCVSPDRASGGTCEIHAGTRRSPDLLRNAASVSARRFTSPIATDVFQPGVRCPVLVSGFGIALRASLTQPRLVVLVVAVLPIRLFVGFSFDVPLWFLLGAFAIDSAKGLLTAAILRRF